MDVLHTALEVTDLAATRAFYEDLLGLEPTRSFEVDGVQNHYVAGDSSSEIQFRVVGERNSVPTGIDHIAIAATDVTAMVERAVEDFDSTVVRPPQAIDRKGIILAAVTDPTGYTVHLIEEQ